MADDQGDKTEEPTEHKLQEARKKGQVCKSQEVISVLLLLVTCAVLSGTGAFMIREISSFTKLTYLAIANMGMEGGAYRYGLQACICFGKVMAPILAAAFIVSIASNLAQTGFIFSSEPLNPTLRKINPIEGFKRIFSLRSLMELAKQIAKLTVIGWITYKIVKGSLDQLKLAVAWELSDTLLLVKKISFKICWWVVVALVALAIIDYLFQRKMFMKDMRMSIQELKDEYKDTEGNPQVKAKVRQLQRQYATGQMMGQVPDSTAVVTNPTHLAVALKYEQGRMDAPIVVAKGERLLAQKIREIAEAHDVPLIENVPLAQALYKSCDLGQKIPTELYKAVAEVLAFVFKLKRRRATLRKRNRYTAYQQRRIR